MSAQTEQIIQFTLLYNRYKKRLYNFVLRLSGNVMVTEDIVQTVFVKLYENFSDLKKRESANYWLFTAARNEYYNYYRKNKRIIELDESALSEEHAEYELENRVELKDMKNIVLNELNKMSDDQKEVYLLKEYGGLSYREIAKTMNIDVDLVKSRLYKVRQKLINKISKLV